MINEELKETIDNREDLLQQKERLKNSITARKNGIRDSFGEMRDELNPLNMFSRKSSSGEGDTINNVKSFLNSAGSSPLVSMGVSTAANLLLRKFVLRRAGFIPRLLLPLAVRKASEFIVAPKINAKIVNAMHSTADTIRSTDVEDVLPDVKDMVPERTLKTVARTGDKIADKLYNAADTIRPGDKPQPLYTSSLLRKKPNRKIAKKLHKLADRIRG